MIHTHSARVTDPISFVAVDGHQHTIPVGPCLIEELEGDCIDIIWGRAGEKSAVMPTTEAASAERQGKLVMLD